MDDSLQEIEDFKRELISCHEEKLRISSSTMGIRSSDILVHFRNTHSGNSIKRSPRSVSSPDEQLAIFCSSMAPGKVHYGRVLRGTLIVDPLVMHAAHSIIEDEVGTPTLVCFYNFAPDVVDGMQCYRIARSLFSRGKKIAIIEPYYEIAADGSRSVRVDNFSQDVKFLNQLGPRVSEGWRNEGKAQVCGKNFSEAIYCYRRGIMTHDQSRLAAVLLSNVATSFMLKQDLICGLLFAFASIIVDNSLFRPYYTAGFILIKLNRSDLVFNCLEQCRRLRAPRKLCEQLSAGIQRSRKEHIPASTWNSEAFSIVASENVKSLLHINSHDTVNSVALKERGNKLYREKKYDESIGEYCLALRGIGEVSTLLNNRAICYARLGSHVEAGLHASAAMLITPTLVKSHYWKAMSLLQLNQKKEAHACCETGLQVVPGHGDLESLRKRIGYSLVEPGEQRRAHSSLRRKPTERDFEEMLGSENASASSVGRFNDILEALDVTGNHMGDMFRDLGFQVDKRVSPFHVEFAHERNWPAACDSHSVMELLTSAYEHARAPDPVLLNASGLMSQPSEPDVLDLMKRLHTNLRSVIEWWYTAPIKSLSPKNRLPYEANMHHSFTNSPCRGNMMVFGTAHISVGFVDLSELLCSHIICSEDHSGPLRWIGYDASPYSVAKSMVISQMIRQQADTDNILQVWYSSSWAENTLHSFRTALKALLDSTIGAEESQMSEQVVKLWCHWMQFDVSLQTARSEWLSRHNLRNHVEIANFRRKMDRIALCRYLVSGEVLEGTVGSAVMFGLPKDKDGEQYGISLDEWFFHCLPIYTILEEVDTGTNFIDAAIRILQKRISGLKKLVFDGNVEIELRHKMVTPQDERTLVEIRKLSPHSMSWSNICDYYSNKAFHTMVQACSGEGTIHCLYSMNWSSEVKGAHLMDFPFRAHLKLLDRAKSGISKLYGSRGAGKYLHEPPFTHSYNLASFSLGVAMLEVWTDKFFKESNLKDREKQVSLIEPAQFDVLGRGTSNIYMEYTFDAETTILDLSV